MEINLLPKIPNTKRYRWHISIIVAFVVLTSSSFVGWQTWKNNTIIKTQEEILQELKGEYNYYSEHLLTNNENSKLLSLYLSELNLLENKHINWVQVFDDISSKLPSDAKITELAYNGNDIIMLDAEFPTIDMEAQYIQWLKTIDWIADIMVVQSDTNQASKCLVEIEIKLIPQSLLKEGI